MSVWGVVVAAGIGSRFGGVKHREQVGGRELWARAVDALRLGGVDEVVVVGDVPGGVAGGARRRDSVAAGLSAVPESADFVLVHDAARPMASSELTRRVIERLRIGDVDAVIPVVGVRDTIKRVESDRVVETVDRGALVAVQTPQGFRTASLRFAHDADPQDAPDDAALIERWGGVVVTVEGEPENIKITYPADLTIARASASHG